MLTIPKVVKWIDYILNYSFAKGQYIAPININTGHIIPKMISHFIVLQCSCKKLPLLPKIVGRFQPLGSFSYRQLIMVS